MSLLDTLQKGSKLKYTSPIMDSKVFGKKDFVSTAVPMINVALSGEVDGGVTSGLLTLAGPSKHFKSLFALVMAAAYMQKHKDAVLLFYDSEFGSPMAYFEALNIDTSRVLHTPITNIEDLKFDMSAQLDNIKRSDKVMILVDSVGNLASKKEVEDAEAGKSVADMTRAKQLKSLFRIVTPHLTIKDIPMIVVNHTYKTQEMYSKDVVSGGCVVAGTKITLPDGKLKSVEDFVVGDQVKTMQGDSEVTNVWNPSTLLNGTPECYKIEFEDGSSCVVSNNHKFLVDGAWVKAKDLRVGTDCTTV